MGLIAMPAVAQQSMKSDMSMCSADAMHASMKAMAAKMTALQLSGTPDRDYAQAISQVLQMEHDLNSWEMKCGKNAKTMKMAGDMQKNLTTTMSSINSSLTSGG
jgi:hypothetical protein